MMDDIMKRLDDETEEQMLYRLGCAKADGTLDVTWKMLADVLNKEFRSGEENYFSESAYRKRWKNYYDAHQMFDKQKAETDGNTDEYVQKIRQLEKEKIKLRDERIDYQKSLREAARRESFVELIERAMLNTVEPFDYIPSPVVDSDDDIIVCLSDLHTGMDTKNWWNTFNRDILRRRLHKYLDEIIDIQRLHKCKICYVVLGGDEISGLIHNTIRLQNNENVIEQVKTAVVYIGEFINELYQYFEHTKVYSVSGNHSRVSPNKDDHLKGEDLDTLIPFCLSLQFANNDQVDICEDMIDNTIGSFVTRSDKLFYLTHGDYDSVSNVVKNLTLMTGKKPDGIIMGHRHSNALMSEHGVKIIQCGCVIGMDDYSIEKRLSGDPEQCVVITNANRAVRCFYDIGLN